jgi:hypothetical protein
MESGSGTAPPGNPIARIPRFDMDEFCSKHCSSPDVRQDCFHRALESSVALCSKNCGINPLEIRSRSDWGAGTSSANHLASKRPPRPLSRERDFLSEQFRDRRLYGDASRCDLADDEGSRLPC